MSPPIARSAADRCPGLLRPHLAADGALVRLRLPGGRLPGVALSALVGAADRFGDGDLQLTSRGNVQIRGIRPDPDGEAPAALVTLLSDAGLLPAPGHERVRNVTASPLSGITGGTADIRSLVDALDRAVCAAPDLAGLPGRFLFGIDDGRGDLAGLRLDLGVRMTGQDHGWLLIGGRLGPSVATAGIPDAIVDLASQFLRVRGRAWHVDELPDGLPGVTTAPDQPRAPVVMPYGVLTRDDGDVALSTAVPLGVLTPAMLDVLRGQPEVVVTPWRGIVLPTAAPGMAPVLADAGFLLDGDAAWSGISACTGAPRCPSGRADTRPVAASLATQGHRGRVHVIGCPRACGAPAGEHRSVRAWEVTG
ncbi:precorrin-3B synthase [Nakamurella alba]|uniref:precorrin-3B synthase n=1 Tax=Nakamurella alba TaxID=2665158 RepID=UPI002AC360EE|nr:precorrin-3B synthase [Nakamurella alba]